jgi:hypothetical protein
VATPAASASEATKCAFKNIGLQDSAGRRADGMKRLLSPIEMRAATLVGIAGTKEPGGERFEIISVAILIVSGMDTDENLRECGHRTSRRG